MNERTHGRESVLLTATPLRWSLVGGEPQGRYLITSARWVRSTGEVIAFVRDGCGKDARRVMLTLPATYSDREMARVAARRAIEAAVAEFPGYPSLAACNRARVSGLVPELAAAATALFAVAFVGAQMALALIGGR